MINTALSANEASYRPPEFNDPNFKQWVAQSDLQVAESAARIA
jgi:hypothetical protein